MLGHTHASSAHVRLRCVSRRAECCGCTSARTGLALRLFVFDSSRQALGGLYEGDSSLFVMDAMSKPLGDGPNDGYEMESVPGLKGFDGWSDLPKDLKLYMFDYMDLESFARMSQVNRSWNKAARKHRKSGEAQMREATFERERQFAAEAAARRRRDAASRCVRTACTPCRKIGRACGKHTGVCLCLLAVFIFYVGWSIMTGIFLWCGAGCGLISGPSSITPDEYTSPPFQNNSCTITGSLINTATCYQQNNVIGYRAIFNVTFNGVPNKAAVGSLGSAFLQCNYDNTLLSPAEALAMQRRFPVGSTWSCYADPLFPLSFAFVTTNNALRTKDLAMLNFDSSVVGVWQRTEAMRVAGVVLGYLWCSLTFMVLYLIFIMSLKAC